MNTETGTLALARSADAVRWGWIVQTSIKLTFPLYVLIALAAILTI